MQVKTPTGPSSSLRILHNLIWTENIPSLDVFGRGWCGQPHQPGDNSIGYGFKQARPWVQCSQTIKSCLISIKNDSVSRLSWWPKRTWKCIITVSGQRHISLPGVTVRISINLNNPDSGDVMSETIIPSTSLMKCVIPTWNTQWV